MTIIDTTAPRPLEIDRLSSFELVAVDLYRDIHKALRAELFTVTAAAGRLDAADTVARRCVAQQVTAVADMLDSHAHHEDAVIEPVLQEHAADLAARMAGEHRHLDARVVTLRDLAAELDTVGRADQRRLGHLLYLELAAFTGEYLVHQDFEERVLMPTIERLVGVDAVIGMHVAIVSSIPPDEMARSLAVMLPAMNLDDRAEMLAGMRDTAPAEVFEGVLGLAQGVLEPIDTMALLRRLDRM